MNSFLFPILSIIASVGLYFFFISPNLEIISELEIKNTEFERSLEDFREIESIIARLETTYAGLTQEDLIKLERFLPEDIDKTQLVSDITNLLLNEEIEAGSINLTDIPKDNSNSENLLHVDKLGVNISFLANYDDFKRALSSIENNLQISELQNVKILPPGSESQPDNPNGLTSFEADLVFYSYNYTQPQ